jgi:hypothetical protein
LLATFSLAAIAGAAEEEGREAGCDEGADGDSSSHAGVPLLLLFSDMVDVGNV